MGVGRDVLCDHRPGGDNGPVPDGNAGQDHRLVADPDVVSNHDIAPVVPGLGDAGHIQPPLLKEDGEDVGGQGAQGVVGAVEQELCAAGDGTELADYQPLFFLLIIH